MRCLFKILICFSTFSFALNQFSYSAEIAQGPVYSVIEITFNGPFCKPTDIPAVEVALSVLFRHEEGKESYRISGFWDGDGQGGREGNIFKVRFCPTRPGRWFLDSVFSNHAELNGQKQEEWILALESNLPGFWLPDTESSGSRWYRRSDGSHPYIFGNTHYTFLSGYQWDGEPSRNDIAKDIAANAQYFKKLRFSLLPDRYPNPDDKPFFDEEGLLTDDGDYSYRPNPSWFHNRVDRAVQTAWEKDLIADLILAGPDTEASRATLRAAVFNSSPAFVPYLRYIAARYGSYPNVWICLSNEYNIRDPKYTEEEIAEFGQIMRSFLAYPIPLSVHASPPIYWSEAFDRLPPWNDHHIIQDKIKNLPESADRMSSIHSDADVPNPRTRPTINDELSYQGEGDGHREGDTVESHLGAFLGGGYASTGEKYGDKLGQYFVGNFNAETHSAADNLKFLRDVIDQNISFWKMAPDVSMFTNLHANFRGLSWPGYEYVLGTDREYKDIQAKLPEGTWSVTRYDVMSRTAELLATEASGDFRFNSPPSRAVLYHFKKNK